MVIEIPLPPKYLAQNARPHWAQRSKATKEYREVTASIAKLAKARWEGRGEWEPCQIRVHSEWFMARKTPNDGLYRPLYIPNAIGALKAAYDGIVDAGLCPSDSHEHLQVGNTAFYRAEKFHHGRSCVVLTIEVMD